jgi:mRNA interferase YafQ
MAAPAGHRLRPTKAFDRDLKRVGKRGDDRDKLRNVIERLRVGTVLEPRRRDHALGGDWQGWRDCHVEPDWLLIYIASMRTRASWSWAGPGHTPTRSSRRRRPGTRW